MIMEQQQQQQLHVQGSECNGGLRNMAPIKLQQPQQLHLNLPTKVNGLVTPIVISNCGGGGGSVSPCTGSPRMLSSPVFFQTNLSSPQYSPPPLQQQQPLQVQQQSVKHLHQQQQPQLHQQQQPQLHQQQQPQLHQQQQPQQMQSVHQNLQQQQFVSPRSGQCSLSANNNPNNNNSVSVVTTGYPQYQYSNNNSGTNTPQQQQHHNSCSSPVIGVQQQSPRYPPNTIIINPAGVTPGRNTPVMGGGGGMGTPVGCVTPVGYATPGRMTPGAIITSGRCTPVHNLACKKRYVDYILASTASTVAIDNKIEQAMDLVKSHLMFAVREEVDVLKEKIGELMERINHLECENTVLRKYATQDTLQQLQHTAPNNP